MAGPYLNPVRESSDGTGAGGPPGPPRWVPADQIQDASSEGRWGVAGRDPTIPRTSVIIPAHNAANTILEQLGALAGQTFSGDWEVIVADNGSTDGTAEIVRNCDLPLPDLQVVEAVAMRGPGYARNVGVAASSGELLAFCDADDVVDRGWLEELTTAALNADAVGGRIEIDRLNSRAAAAWRRGEVPRSSLMTILDFLPFAWTANLAVWREAFDSVGGFPRYEVGEDVALSWNLQIRGFDLDFAKNAIVHYRLRDDYRGQFRQWHQFGIGQARLYREYRSYGAQRRPYPGVLKAWLRLAIGARHLLGDQSARGRWLRQLAFESGHPRGAWRYRTLFLG
jgi:glycosyltransferase involved in cell wall biosynthesis